VDNIEFEILEDATITTRIGGVISDANHSGADKFLRHIETLAGGEVSREKIAKVITRTKRQEHNYVDMHTRWLFQYYKNPVYTRQVADPFSFRAASNEPKSYSEVCLRCSRSGSFG
jgi:hypothetical protein